MREINPEAIQLTPTAADGARSIIEGLSRRGLTGLVASSGLRRIKYIQHSALQLNEWCWPFRTSEQIIGLYGRRDPLR
jgi:hypothetical protein